MSDSAAYLPAHFIPFTTEAYLRLIERASETWWLLHLATLGIGAVAVAMAVTGRHRAAGPLLALLWLWAGYGFLHRFYTELNWAGRWFELAFYVQAMLLAVVLPLVCAQSKVPALRFWSGLALAITGLTWPLATLAGRHNILQMEVAGIHPDPTAVLTLGLLLLVMPRWWFWLLAAIPLFWCLIAGLTLTVLNLPQAPALYAAMALAIAVVICGGTLQGLTRPSGK